ncbi:MAG: GMC family oxidoreductase, partial [Candidatus Dadabacteria bacterium]
MNYDCDVCVIGSGAGGGPVAYTLALAGRSVIVLEKGPWFDERDFYKDELAAARRPVYVSDKEKEPHVVEEDNNRGGWQSVKSSESSWNFWNGNCVGGATNFMSGYFHRLKPMDFRLLSEFGPIEGADITDWPISYEDLEPYYDKVEKVVGISGKVINHPFLEPRSSADFPYPPLAENPVAGWIDDACRRMGLNAIPTPRAILSGPEAKRGGC